MKLKFMSKREGSIAEKIVAAAINIDNKVRFRYPDEYCFRLFN